MQKSGRKKNIAACCPKQRVAVAIEKVDEFLVRECKSDEIAIPPECLSELVEPERYQSKEFLKVEAGQSCQSNSEVDTRCISTEG